MSETYVPNARDAVVAYFGRDTRGNLRCYCVRCNDKTPLGPAYPDRDGPSKVYGDDLRDWRFDDDGKIVACDKYALTERTSLAVGHFGSWDTCEACDGCGVTIRELSVACQREHDEQQARWARGPITHVVEMGMVGAVRCRIY